MGLKVAILAGGKTSRSLEEPKPLWVLRGRPLIDYVLGLATLFADPKDIWVVLGYGAEKVEAHLRGRGVQFAFQEKPLGTGHAALVALEAIRDADEALIMYADTVLLRRYTICGLINVHRLKNADFTLLVARSFRRFPYGLVKRDESGNVCEVAELEKPKGSPPWEFNSGLYVVRPGSVLPILRDLPLNRKKKQYLLTDAVRMCYERGLKIADFVTFDEAEIVGINTKSELEKAEEILLAREAEERRVLEETTIRFGTGGWRAEIARGFTFANVRRTVQAIVNLLIEEGKAQRGVAIGYDHRFLSEDFAKTAAEVLAANGIKVVLAENPLPTPVVTFTVVRRKLGGGIIFTASHNPPQYNGLKFETWDGLPAPVDITRRIQEYANSIPADAVPWIPLERAIKHGAVRIENLRNPYLDDIERKIDIAAIRGANLRVAFDPMFGVGRSTLQILLDTARCSLTIIHGTRDPLFGGMSPAPSKSALSRLMDIVKKGNFHIGLAVDGDADRIAVVDERGNYLHANHILLLLYYYLRSYRGGSGGIVRNLATTHLLDKLAASFGENTLETPVGFKYIAEGMIKTGALLGGESSGGATIKGHILEKDGIYCAMLLVEMLAKTGKTVSELLREIYRRIGLSTVFHEEAIPITPKVKVRVQRFLETADLKEVNGIEVSKTSRMDGLKLYFGDVSWVLVRFSGTEPLVRIMGEAENAKKLRTIVSGIKKMLRI